MRKYLGYIIGVIVLLVSGIGFIYALTSLVTFRDILQAIDDVSLELAITASLLVFLLGVAWIMHEWSLRLQRPKKRPMNLKMRLRVQRGDYPKSNETENWWIDFWQGISTEMYGAVVTGVTLGMVVLVFQQYSAIQNRKAELILQMGSPDNGFALEAARQLDAEGWLEDGTLRGAYLVGADLRGINLFAADLANSNLAEVDLTNANLSGANLTDANLTNANLTNVELYDTDLTSTNLRNATLTNAKLRGADLTNAFLAYANLPDTVLPQGNWINVTILPNGSAWTPETDITSFTEIGRAHV